MTLTPNANHRSKGLIAFVLIALLLPAHTVVAQIAGQPASGYINQQLRSLFSTIAPPSPQPPFFYDMAAHFVDSTWYAQFNNDTINTMTWATLYDEIWFAHYDTNQFERVDSMLNRSFRFEADTVVVGLIDYTFAVLLPGALTDTTYFYVDTTGPTLEDNPFAPGPPYATGNVFSVAALPDELFSGDLVFRCDPAFLFIDPSKTKAYEDGDLLLQLNFDDGTGWHTVSTTTVSHFDVSYDSAGHHTLQARVLNTLLFNTTVNQAFADLVSPGASVGLPFPDEVWTFFDGMDVEVYESCSEQSQAGIPEKYIIFAPGFGQAKKQTPPREHYGNYFHKTGMAALRNHGYTILIIRWRDSRESIVDNALRIPNLISYLKCNKLDPNSDNQHPFVCMGASSGAVMMRYALAWMEQNPAFSPCWQNLHHNTRLYFSFEGEHQGAYIPLAMQELYHTAGAVGSAALGGAFISPWWPKKLKQNLDILNSPAAREMLNVHYTTENNGNYGPHADRLALLDDFDRLNGNDGYPEHVKMIAVGNGLFTGEHQTGIGDTCVMQPGDLYLGLQTQQTARVLFWTLDISDLNLELRAVENGQPFFTAEATFFMPTIQLGWQWVQQCAPFIGWPCVSFPRVTLTVTSVPFLTPDITRVSNGVLEWDVMPGGRLVGDLVEDEYMPPWDFGFASPNILGFSVQLGQYTNAQQGGGCPTYTLAGGSYRNILGGQTTTALTTQTLNFCFVPNFSAIDYRAPVAQDHDLYNENINTKMANTPFDVIIGEVNGMAGYPQPQQEAPWLPSSKKFARVTYPALNRTHVTLINHLMPDTFLMDNINGSLKAHYLNREVGDEEMFLDNLELDRGVSIFQAQYRITAGDRTNPLYDYPGQGASQIFRSYTNTGWINPNPYGYNLPNNGIFAQPDPFHVMTSITTQLVAQVSITDVGIVVDPFGWVWQVLQPQYVCDSAYTDTTVYNKRGDFEARPTDETSTEVVLYPNPVERGGELMLEGLVEADYQFVLTSLDGKIIQTRSVEVTEGALLKVGVPNDTSPGVYILTARTNKQVLTFKIIVL